MPSKLEQFILGDVPETLLLEATEIMKVSATAFISEGEHIGSGTFAKIHGRFGILTAGHVWQAVSARANRVGIVVADGPHRFEVETSAFTPLLDLYRDANDPAWGPDLQFLQIPSAHVGTIQARKLFMDLTHDAENKMAIACRDQGFVAMAGFPAEFARKDAERFHGEPVQVIKGGFSAIPGQRIERGEFDYYETVSRQNTPGLPSSRLLKNSTPA